MQPVTDNQPEVEEPPVAWVTGSSRGIGRAVALAFGRMKWRVAVHYRERSEDAECTVRMIAQAGGEALAYRADVTDAGQLAKLVDSVLERWHRLDVVISNAAIADSRLLLRTRSEDWIRVISTNLTGVFHTLRACAGPMQKQGGGHIVVVGSYAGFQGRAGQTSYAASKAGLVGLMRTASREWGNSNVRVNLVLPGLQRTELSAEVMPDVLPDHVLGRAPDLDEVARSIAHLATCHGVSGQVWNLDSRPL